MFAQLASKTFSPFNESCKEALRDSLEKIRYSNQKLMIYQVLTSKITLFAQISEVASLLSKRTLGVNVVSLSKHPNSNLRAFAFVLILALSESENNLLTKRQVVQKLASLKKDPPQIKNYLLKEKFNQRQVLEIFSAMHSKIVDLVEGGLSIYEVIKVYSSYLEITSFFLRSLLVLVNLPSAEDCLFKLSTNQIYSILSEYLDLSYIINKNVFLFPDLKIFISTPDDEEFIFGKYYDNCEELRNHENQVRQSTIDYINERNEKHQSMKMSTQNLDVTMSQCFFSERLGEIHPYISSKAPTPEFGDGQNYHFESFPVGVSEELMRKKQNEQNEKQTKPQSNFYHNILFGDIEETRTQQGGQKFEQFENNSKHGYFDEDNDPQTPATNKNFIGSAFYLHQFDFYKKTNLIPGPNFEQMCSERVLLKGSSMVEKGNHFLQQVGQLKKEIENKMMNKEKKKISINSIPESTSNRGKFGQKESRNKKNAKDGDSNRSNSKSSNTNGARRNQRKMTMISDVYSLNIDREQKGRPHNQSEFSISKQKNSNRLSPTPKNLLNVNRLKTLTCNLQQRDTSIQKRVQEKPKKSNEYRLSQNPNKCITSQKYFEPKKIQPQNHNHIHIHIHNEPGKKNKLTESSYSCNNKKFQQKYEKELQAAFKNALPEIIKQIESHSRPKNHISQKNEESNVENEKNSQLNQSIKSDSSQFAKNQIHESPYLIYKNSNTSSTGQIIATRIDKQIKKKQWNKSKKKLEFAKSEKVIKPLVQQFEDNHLLNISNNSGHSNQNINNINITNMSISSGNITPSYQYNYNYLPGNFLNPSLYNNNILVDKDRQKVTKTIPSYNYRTNINNDQRRNEKTEQQCNYLFTRQESLKNMEQKVKECRYYPSKKQKERPKKNFNFHIPSFLRKKQSKVENVEISKINKSNKNISFISHNHKSTSNHKSKQRTKQKQKYKAQREDTNTSNIDNQVSSYSTIHSKEKAEIQKLKKRVSEQLTRNAKAKLASKGSYGVEAHSLNIHQQFRSSKNN